MRDGSATRVGTLAGSQRLRLVLGLTPPHAAAEQAFLTALVTKGSPQYHHYLTPAEFTARFGPSAASEAKVVAWATSQGLDVSQRYPDRLLVDVTGTAATVSKAFRVTLNTYRYQGETDFANAQPATIPATLSGVLDNVEGLDNLQRSTPDTYDPGKRHAPQPYYSAGPALAPAFSGHGNAVGAARAATNRARAARTAPAAIRPQFSNGLLDPNNINSGPGYDFSALYRQGHCCNPYNDPNQSPVQTTIDLIGFGSISNTDLNTFAGDFNLAWSLTTYNVDGTPVSNDTNNLEDTLDVEYATATANSHGAVAATSHINQYNVANYNSGTFTDAWNAMYSANNARTASGSYGGAESYAISAADMDTTHNVFNNMLGSGWTIIASSGDHGSYDDCSHLSVNYPASDLDVTAVGGTRLSLNGDGTFSSETAWSPDGDCSGKNGNNAGSGGGCSTHFAAPLWQEPLLPCGANSRAVPDISLNADGATGQFVIYNGLIGGVGGTSIAAPEIAGFAAQANAYALVIGDSTVGLLSSNLWDEGQNNSAPHNPFYDITSGCNYSSGQSGYCAGTGYDEVTGWGSANMLQLARMVNWFDSPDSASPTVSYSGPATGHWYSTDQDVSWTVSDPNVSSGIGGFTQSWDTPLPDPTTESHGADGGLFWDGPEFPNASSGYLALSWAGTGCHTAHVNGWDNMGLSTGDVTYGPLCYDPTTPSGVVSIDNHQVSTSSTTASLALTATDQVPSDPIQYMRFSTDEVNYSAWQPYSSTATIALPSGDGRKLVFVEFENAAGTVSPAEYDSIILDTKAPALSTPTTVLANKPLVSSKPQVKVSWAGSDGGAGVQSYELQESVDGGAYQDVTLPSPTTTSVYLALTANKKYQFRVRGTDGAGNVSAYKVGQQRTLSLVQENASSIHYSSGWARTAVTGASGGYVQHVVSNGATATITCTCVGVGLVTTEGPNYGSAKEQVDGGSATSFTDHATSVATQRLAPVEVAASGSHTLVVTDTGTGSTKRLDVDAFVILD